jgi:predicted DsbA family dithiol-disulfide isomerase
VGKAYLDRALQARPQHPFRIEWHPFQLNPDLPPDGMDRMDYMALKFGSRENIARVHEPLLAHAEKAGIDFDLPAIRRTPNTLDAHRLIHWAGIEKRQTAMVSALFRAYWREGRDIGDRTVLASIAGEVGLDRGAMARLLDSDADRADIADRVRHSMTRGVQSVPTFIIAGRHAVQGAQPADLWTSLIDDLIAQAGAAEL